MLRNTITILFAVFLLLSVQALIPSSYAFYSSRLNYECNPQAGKTPSYTTETKDTTLFISDYGATEKEPMPSDVVEDLPVHVDLTFSSSLIVNQEIVLSVALTSEVDIQEVNVRLLLPNEFYSSSKLNWTGQLLKDAAKQLNFSIIANKTGSYLVQVVATSNSLGSLPKVCSQSRYVSVNDADSISSLPTAASVSEMNILNAVKTVNPTATSSLYSMDSPGGLTVSGYCYYYDENNITWPARYARVELWDGDLPVDVKLATTYVGSDGYYQFPTIENNDGSLEGGYDIYVKIFCDSDLQVYVTDSLDNVYYTQTPKSDNVSDGNYNMGSYVIAGANRGCFGLYDSVIDEFEWLHNRVSWNRSEVQIHWPSEDWPHSHGDSIDVPSGWEWDKVMVYHEYAHCVHYAARGGSFPSGTGGSTHYVDSETNVGFALTEGWAEFMGCALTNTPICTYGGSLESTIYADSPFGHGDAGDWDGNAVEGAVASVFWDMFDGTSSSDYPNFSQIGDYIDNEFSKLWTIFLNNDPNSIDEIWNAWSPKDTNLWAIFYNSRINKDSTSPVGSITINGGAVYTSSATVTLSLNYSDALSGVSQQRFSNDGNWDNETWEDPSTTKSWTLTSSDGTKTVYYQVKDNSGLLSSTTSDNIVLDTTSPSTPIPDDDVSGWAPSNNRTFSWNASSDSLSGVSGYYWKVDSGTETWISSTSIVTPAQADGTHTFFLRAMDNAGNIGSYGTHVFQIDSVAPTGSIVINGGAAYSSSTSVLLTLTYSDALSGVSQVRFSDDGVWDTEVWEPATTSKSWTLTDTEGAKTVYYQVKDNAALTSIIYSATIILDTSPPQGSIQINNQAIYTTSELVTLTLTSTDALSGVSQMRFSNDGVWDTEQWESPVVNKAWTLPSGEGAKTIYYQIKDNVGLSTTYSATITVDTTPPTGSILINSGAACTGTTTVNLALSSTDAISGIAQMRFSNDNLVWSTWETYATSKTWALDGGDGTKNVYVQFKDNAGLTVSLSNSIVLDTTVPVANAGQTQTVTQGNKVTFDASTSTDSSGIISYTWDFGDGAQGSGVTATHTYSNSGTYTAKLTVQDLAGNTATAQVNIVIQPQSSPTPAPTQTQTSTPQPTVSPPNPTPTVSPSPTANPTQTASPTPSSQPTNTADSPDGESSIFVLVVAIIVVVSVIGGTIFFIRSKRK